MTTPLRLGMVGGGVLGLAFVEACVASNAAAGAWTDAVRRFIPPEQKLYSWWSYRARDWSTSDRGRRLDHVWTSTDLANRLSGARVLRDARGWTQPSDHAPVIVDLAD